MISYKILLSFYRDCCGYSKEVAEKKAKEYLKMQDKYYRGMK